MHLFVFLIGLAMAMFMPINTGIHTIMAAEQISIVAVVNGDPVTNIDLNNRMKFVRQLSRLEVSDEILRRDTLQALIAEKLKIQEAQKLIPDALEKAQQPAQDLVNQAYQQGNKPGLQVLSDMGIEPTTAIDRFYANILWSNALRVKFRRQFDNLDNLAQLELERIKKSVREPQVKLSEILLVPNQKRPKQATLALAEKIIQAIQTGVPFEAIAQQYSESATAAKGGDVIWIAMAGLPDPIIKAIEKAEIGEVVGPIEAGGRFYILRYEERRELGQYESEAAILSLVRAVVPVALTDSQNEQQQAAQKLLRATKDVKSCEDMLDVHEKLGSGLPAVLNNLAISDLTPQLQQVMLPLQVGEKTNPLSFSEGMVMFMLCARVEKEIKLPDLETLKQAEFEKLYSTISSRYIVRLERAAAIEYRS